MDYEVLSLKCRISYEEILDTLGTHNPPSDK